MKRLTLLLTIVAVLAVPSVAEAFPCYQNGKWLPSSTCAFINMNEYATGTYFKPVMTSFWDNPGVMGRFHSRWVAYVPAESGLLVRRQVILSARQCGNRFCVYDHRKGTWWP